MPEIKSESDREGVVWFPRADLLGVDRVSLELRGEENITVSQENLKGFLGFEVTIRSVYEDDKQCRCNIHDLMRQGCKCQLEGNHER